MFNLFIMKHINFNDPTTKKKVFDIDIDQFSIIEQLYNKGINKEFEDEIKKKVTCL